MRNAPRRSLAGLAAALLVGAALAPAHAASERGLEASGGRAEHERIVAFWTPERVAQAVPRDFEFDPATRGFRPAPAKKPDGKPGGGKPGGDSGGDSSATVAAASWEGEGGVAQTTGKVLFQMSGSYYVCSASVVDDQLEGQSLVLTAAHCVYDETKPEATAFATEWVFIPDYDALPERLTADGKFCASTAHGCWTAEAIAVHAGYAAAGGFNDQAVQHDFAVVRVAGGGLDGTTELDAAVGSQSAWFGGEVDADGAETPDTYLFGYPAEKKYDGTDLVYSLGPLGRDPNTGGATYRVGSGLNGGSSGGGWYTPFDPETGDGLQISVNSYGYAGSKAMHGPVLGDDALAVYEAAESAAGNVVAGSAG